MSTTPGRDRISMRVLGEGICDVCRGPGVMFVEYDADGKESALTSICEACNRKQMPTDLDDTREIEPHSNS